MNSVMFIHTTLVPQRNVTISVVQHRCRKKKQDETHLVSEEPSLFV